MAATGRGGRVFAPLAPLSPGKLLVLEPALGLPGVRGRARCSLPPLLEDPIERHHVVPLVAFAGCLVFCFTQTQTWLTNVACVYFSVDLSPLCTKQDYNVTVAFVAGSPGSRLVEIQKVVQVEMLLAEGAVSPRGGRGRSCPQFGPTAAPPSMGTVSTV